MRYLRRGGEEERVELEARIVFRADAAARQRLTNFEIKLLDLYQASKFLHLLESIKKKKTTRKNDASLGRSLMITVCDHQPAFAQLFSA